MDRVLVVEDDDDIRDLIVLALTGRGLRVHDFADPVAALDFASTATCDAAVLDWSMPRMHGGELCARLRELPHLRDAPVVIVTAHADAETRDRATAAGATRFVTKPFSLKQLAEVVVDLLAG
ncbi:response regulator [Nocardioides xinjiangensis]|uniref:response regulator n=1 Tax=Nocardioides xinjiangensis TaxID=2817376 RepID=UPI001B300B8B|nr:response regulator [Nocardioides sp. SYSU D00514]